MWIWGCVGACMCVSACMCACMYEGCECGFGDVLVHVCV